MVDFRQTPRLLPLFLLVAGVGHVSAGEVPFPTEHTVDGAFDGASSVYAADVDGDGDLDVLGAAVVAKDIAWWENTAGDGTAWTEHTVDGAFDGAISVYAADVDGDGDLDVLGAALIADDIAWWENTLGDGTAWTEHTVDGAFDGARSVYAADVDGDGDLDVLGAAETAGDIAWWENTAGDGTAWTEHTVDGAFAGARSVFAADVDGDGDLDVLGAAVDADAIAWWENTAGDGTAWTEHTVDGAFDGVSSVFAADVDGDGDLDVLGAAGGFANDIAWWENTAGDGTAWTEHTVDGAFVAAGFVFAADVDGDGDLDVLGAAVVAGDIAWWENETIHRNAVYPAEHTVDGNFDLAISVFAADVDGDGDLDVLGAAGIANDIAWWENTAGDGTAWTEHTVDGDFNGANSVFAADVDGDGDLDVLGAADLADDIAWWENTLGDGTAWTEHTVDGAFDFANSVFAADVDGDGDLDVLGAAFFADDIAWWENTAGDGTAWTEHPVDEDFDGAVSVYAADVDGDGDLDVLGAASSADDIAWWENTLGDGTAWTGHPVDVDFDGAVSVSAADVDGDGDLDVLGAAQLADDITWWENRGGQFGLPTTSLAASPLTLPIEHAVLQIDAAHKGRTGDTDVELVTFELLFEDNTLTPLTTVQANDAIENLRIYLDDGSGDFDDGLDTLVDTVSTLSLTNGVQQFSFADGNPEAQVLFGADRRYFVVLDLVSAGLVNMLRVTHLTESSSTGEDRDHDIPLKLEFLSDISTPTITLEAGAGAGCPADLVRANQTLSGAQTLEATETATLGPNLIVDGTDIAVNAPVVDILGDTTISGPFSIGNTPSCP